MPDDAIADAREVADQLFPQARWAVVTGSVLTARRTPGSELGTVVVLPDNDPAAPHRDSRYWDSWPVELFVHDATALAHTSPKIFGSGGPPYTAGSPWVSYSPAIADTPRSTRTLHRGSRGGTFAADW